MLITTEPAMLNLEPITPLTTDDPADAGALSRPSAVTPPRTAAMAASLDVPALRYWLPFSACPVTGCAPDRSTAAKLAVLPMPFTTIVVLSVSVLPLPRLVNTTGAAASASVALSASRMCVPSTTTA